MRVWVDCTAAPHPLVLRPIIERLGSAGHEVEITAREYGQTHGMLERLGLPYTSFGRHAEGSTVAKGAAVASRSLQLLRWARPRRFDLAIAHGSVDIAVVSRLLRIPSVQMQDYEFAGLQRKISFRSARRVLAPDAIPVERLVAAGASADRLFRFPGLKEDYYLADFRPDPAVLGELGLERDGVIVVVRPPPESSAYHADNPLYERVLDRLGAEPETVAVVIPRTAEQGERLRARAEPSLIVPRHAIDGQSLIAFADLVVSAGGTMNREAVALGTPVYTIFTGPMGAVDEQLIAEGRLRELTDPDAIELRKRDDEPGVREPRDPGLLVDAVLAACS
jgi:hypothetical protein